VVNSKGREEQGQGRARAGRNKGRKEKDNTEASYGKKMAEESKDREKTGQGKERPSNQGTMLRDFTGDNTRYNTS